MSQYSLALDIGASRISAATARVRTGGACDVRSVRLGRASDWASSDVYVTDSGMLFGDAAHRRGLTRPDRMIRSVVTRVGDDTALRVGGRDWRAVDMYASMVEWVVATARDREGVEPSTLRVVVPGTWGQYRREEVSSALASIGLGRAELVATSQAAASEYEFATPVRVGRVLAVCDFGASGARMDILRRDRDAGFIVARDEAELSTSSGEDFDDAILARILALAGVEPDPAALGSPTSLAGIAARREAREAKEALSFDSEAVIPVVWQGANKAIRITRGEFESMIEPSIMQAVETLNDALDAGGVSTSSVDAVLLIGGSARIPRVAQLFSEHFDCPIVVDIDPDSVAVRGAARASAPLDAHSGSTGPETATTAETARTRPHRKRRIVPTVGIAASAFVLAGAIIAGGATALNPGATTSAGANGVSSARALDDERVGSLAAPAALDPVSDTGGISDSPSEAPRRSDPRQWRDPGAVSSPKESDRSVGGGSSPTGQSPNSPQPGPAPSDPQPGPAPTDPVPDPTPTEPAPDPTPTEPAPDPTPTEPAPTEPAPEPEPSDPAPIEPAPEPTTPLP